MVEFLDALRSLYVFDPRLSRHFVQTVCVDSDHYPPTVSGGSDVRLGTHQVRVNLRRGICGGVAVGERGSESG